MQKIVYFIFVLFFFLNSCKNYDDLELIIEDSSIYLLDETISIALEGSEKLNGTVEIKIGKKTIGEGKIKSNISAKFSEYKIDFSKLNEDLISFINTAQKKNKIELNLIFSNEKEKLKFEQKCSILINCPPISNIIEFEGENFKRLYRNRKSSLSLSKAIKNHTNFLDLKSPPSNIDILKQSTPTEIKILVDTIYDKTFILRDPTSYNRYESLMKLNNWLESEDFDETPLIEKTKIEKAKNGNYMKFLI